MNPDQYVATKSAVTAGLAVYIRRYASLFVSAPLDRLDWIRFLQTLYPEVQRRYAEMADLGRKFYDAQRELHFPELPRNEMYRGELQWEGFVRAMEPARKELSQADAPQSAVTKVTLAAVREVEMAARRQVIAAVKNDQILDEYIENIEIDAQLQTDKEEVEKAKRHLTAVEQAHEQLKSAIEPVQKTRTVKGWARVATGRETCAWCLMLISRGPVYESARTAGLLLDNEVVADVWRDAGEDLEAFKSQVSDSMNDWHAGCDCIVVPVFDTENWVGKAAYEHANQLWIDAANEASELMSSGESRTNNRYKETLNALRRRLERGDVSVPSYAHAA
ncbi:head maturation protease [Mycobacterium phage Phlei]|uniref:Capsid maturation protease n=1 Tax=Mycobacterium phage Phlei TaxID=1690684 RepID=A0A0N9BDP9_9CAUD|nr:head maturation protease [Mycobacterium phage Phlei]ALA48123.1 hypothetical protein [Mycobacterium phage Phlei]